MGKSTGGSFLPGADYMTTGDWDFQGDVTFSGGVTDTAPSFVNATLTGTTTITGTTTVGAGATLTSPALVTPTLGVATATSLNGLTVSTSTGTLTIANSSSLITSGGNAVTLTSTGTTGVTLPTTGTLSTLAGAETLTNKTITGAINTDFKVLAANATFTANVTPATLTGFSWTVVAGTYVFECNMPTVMTTSGGLAFSFLLTTAVLTSIQYESYAATASDNTTAVSTNGTTTTSATKIFDSATAAYTHVRVRGSMVVGTGGTFAFQACQNTSGGGGDATTVSIGAYARMTRVA